MESVTPLVLAVLTIILLRYLFRIHFFYSMVMFSITIVASIVLQGFIIFVLQVMGMFTLEEIRNNENVMYSVQLVTSLLTIGISWIIVKYRIWFTFVPFDEHYKENYIKKENVYILFLIILSIPLSVLLIDLKDLLLAVIVFVLILTILLKLLYTKEKRNEL